jgi:hypothetical protein
MRLIDFDKSRACSVDRYAFSFFMVNHIIFSFQTRLSNGYSDPQRYINGAQRFVKVIQICLNSF